MKHRLLLDVDGIIADFTGALCAALKAEGHGDFNDLHLTEWDLTKCLPKSAHGAVGRIMTRPGFFRSIPRYEGAQAFYKALCKRAEVIAVTTVKGRAQEERYDWLLSMGFNDQNIVLVEEHGHKTAVPGDVIIDDRIETLAACPHWFRIVLDRPWNQKHVKGVARARDYAHILEILTAAGVR